VGCPYWPCTLRPVGSSMGPYFMVDWEGGDSTRSNNRYRDQSTDGGNNRPIVVPAYCF